MNYPGELGALLGMIAASENEPEKAIEHNLTALELDPRNAHAWHNMGLTYLLTGRPKDAIRCFGKAMLIEERADTRRFLEQANDKVTD